MNKVPKALDAIETVIKEVVKILVAWVSGNAGKFKI